MIPFFDLKRQYQQLQDGLEKVILNVLRGGNYIGGSVVGEFEDNLARYVGVGEVVSCGSCTHALEIILRAYNIGPGDEVIVPDFTWISDAEVVTAVGAKPVFVDVLPGKLTIDPDQVAMAINERTKAIIAVHLYGLPCRMAELMALGAKHGIKVIEDCAQSIGAMYQGKMVGTIGDAAAFSFYPTKNLGAYGDGGAITTNDKALAERIRLLSNHGQPRRDVHLIEGVNSRLDAIQAAVLNYKFNYLEQWTKRRQEIAKDYTEGINSPIVELPATVPQMESVHHLYVVRSNQRDRLMGHLSANGVATAIHYPHALHQMPAYAYLNHQDAQYPVATYAASSVVSLPIFPELENSEVHKIIGHINKF